MSNTISRRGLLSAGVAVSVAGRAAAANERPNIILCMGDDHGWIETGYNGHPHVKTPVLDEMAQSGLRFDRFYSGAPLCSPTRGSVMTGRHPNRYGVFSAGWSIRPQEITLAHLLRKAGYACGHFGKWHLGPVKKASPTSPGAMGFHEWLSHDNFFELNPPLSRNGGPVEQFRGESSQVVVDEAIRFIDKAKSRKRPFFTVVWFGSPHEPYSSLEQDLALYNDVPEPLRSRLAEITAMDRAMGRLRQHLRTSGLSQNTLLWYCGDNGVPRIGRMNMAFRGFKGQVYDGGIRVPGVLEWPERISRARVTDVNTVTSDMLPTICDLAGIAKPARPLDGLSLRPLLDGSMKARPSPICFWAYDVAWETKHNPEPYIDPKLQEGTTPTVTPTPEGMLTRNFRNLRHPRIANGDFAGPAAILGNDYKLVAPTGMTSDASPKELYAIRSDPGETKDVRHAQPAVAEQIERQLRDWQSSVLKSLTGADYERGQA